MKLIRLASRSREEHMYRCGYCDEEMVFSYRLPSHLDRGHVHSSGTRCDGRLSYVASRKRAAPTVP